MSQRMPSKCCLQHLSTARVDRKSNFTAEFIRNQNCSAGLVFREAPIGVKSKREKSIEVGRGYNTLCNDLAEGTALCSKESSTSCKIPYKYLTSNCLIYSKFAWLPIELFYIYLSVCAYIHTIYNNNKRKAKKTLLTQKKKKLIVKQNSQSYRTSIASIQISDSSPILGTSRHTTSAIFDCQSLQTGGRFCSE